MDNHDDFGGYAKRNVFAVNNRLLIGYRGSQTIDNPSSYPVPAHQLLIDLGVDLQRFETTFDDSFYTCHNMKLGMFFEQLAQATRVLCQFSIGNFSVTPPIKPSREKIDKLPLKNADKDNLYELIVEPKNYLSDSGVSILLSKSVDRDLFFKTI